MRTHRASDRGSATILVTAIGAVALLFAFRQFTAMVIEHQSIDNSLVEVRAYWAAKGFLNYTLSRTFYAGGCSASCGNGNAEVVSYPTAYLKDLACYTLWSYPELTTYQFGIQTQLKNDPNAPSGQIGEVLMQVQFQANAPNPPAPCFSGPPPPPVPPNQLPDAISAVAQLRPVAFRYCLAASASTACGAHPTGSLPGYQHITTVLRPNS